MNRKHRVEERLTRTQVMMCVCVCEPSCTDSSRSAFQHKPPFLLQWKTCKLLAALQSHGADTQLCSPGSDYSTHRPESPLNNNCHIQPPDWEDRVGKDESKICFVTNIYHMCMTWHTTSPTRYNHIYSAMLKSGHPLSFWTMMLFYRKFCWCNAVTIIADYDF